MDKISSIIPSNERIENVNMRKTSPVRSGVPSFGREVVKASNHKALPKTTLSEASWTYDLLNKGPDKLKIQAQKVDQLADRFFMEQANGSIKDVKVETNPVNPPIAENAPANNTITAQSDAEAGMQINGQNLAVIA